jgi:hypothetical protein
MADGDEMTGGLLATVSFVADTGLADAFAGAAVDWALVQIDALIVAVLELLGALELTLPVDAEPALIALVAAETAVPRVAREVRATDGESAERPIAAVGDALAAYAQVVGSTVEEAFAAVLPIGVQVDAFLGAFGQSALAREDTFTGDARSPSLTRVSAPAAVGWIDLCVDAQAAAPSELAAVYLALTRSAHPAHVAGLSAATAMVRVALRVDALTTALQEGR